MTRPTSRAAIPKAVGALAAFRCIGGGAFAAPGVAAKTFGLPANADASYLIRLFAARNLAMAAGVLLGRGEARRLMIRAGIACDVLDIAAGGLGWREGKKPKDALVDAGLSTLAAGLGLAALASPDDRARG